MAFFSKLKERLGFGSGEDFVDEFEDEYVEIDPTKDIGPKAKIAVKSFIVSDFGSIKEALDSIREGYTIALINIKPLKDKDIVELKRAVNKIKKTCDAVEGDIAGISEDWIVVTPAFAYIHRDKSTEEMKE